MTTALATTTNTSAGLAFEPTDVGSALQLATILVNSRLLPRSLGTPEAAFTVIMAGRELGLTAMQSLRSLHVIEGKPVMSSDLMMALCLRSPLCERFALVESTDAVATYEAKRAGQEPVRLSFTAKQAEAAGLLNKDNWKKFRAAMLRARCISALARIVFADLMLGVYETDEIAPPGKMSDVVSTRVVEDFDEVADAVADDTATAVAEAIAAFGEAPTLVDLGGQRNAFAALRLRIDADQKAALRAAYDEASARLAPKAEPATTEAA